MTESRNEPERAGEAGIAAAPESPPSRGRGLPRAVVWIAVVAGLVGLAFLFRLLVPSSMEPEGRYLEVVHCRFPEGVIREGACLRKNDGPNPPGPTTGAGDPAAVLDQLFVQRYRPGSQTVVGADLLESAPERITLAAGEVFRLGMSPARPGHVLIFRVSGDLVVEQIFPNPDYGSADNPLQPGWSFHIPYTRDWFNMAGVTEPQRFWAVISLAPQTELSELYAGYIKTLRDEDRARESAQLRAHLRGLQASPPAAVRVVTFSILGG